MSEKSFSFFGQTLNISSEQDAYNELREEFSKRSQNAYNKFKEAYNTHNKNIEDVINNAYNQCAEIMMDEINRIIQVLVDNKIYDIDENQFMDKYEPKVTFPDAYNRIEIAFLEIIEDEEEKDRYRTERRQNRGRFVGGGFGVSGAIKGVATAGAMNTATNLAHGAFNLGAKAISSIGAAMKKVELFDNPEVFNSLANAKERLSNIWSMEDVNNFADIILNTDVTNAEAINESIEKIKKSKRDHFIAMNYANALKGFNPENIAMAQKYYKYLSIGKFKLHIPSIVMFILCFILIDKFENFATFLGCAAIGLSIYIFVKMGKMKKVWNLLTVDGAVVHDKLKELKK